MFRGGGGSSQPQNGSQDGTDTTEEVIGDQHFDDLCEQFDAMEVQQTITNSQDEEDALKLMVIQLHSKHCHVVFSTKYWRVAIAWLCLLPNSSQTKPAILQIVIIIICPFDVALMEGSNIIVSRVVLSSDRASESRYEMGRPASSTMIDVLL